MRYLALAAILLACGCSGPGMQSPGEASSSSQVQFRATLNGAPVVCGWTFSDSSAAAIYQGSVTHAVPATVIATVIPNIRYSVSEWIGDCDSAVGHTVTVSPADGVRVVTAVLVLGGDG